MSRRRANTILTKPCDFPLIVGQQTETRPSGERVGTKGKTFQRQRNTRGWRSNGGGRGFRENQTILFLAHSNSLGGFVCS